jgi:hypothetical protein
VARRKSRRISTGRLQSLRLFSTLLAIALISLRDRVLSVIALLPESSEVRWKLGDEWGYCADAKPTRKEATCEVLADRAHPKKAKGEFPLGLHSWSTLIRRHGRLSSTR